MGIQIEASLSQPAVVFDKVFLQRLSIDQHVVLSDAPPPKYRISIEYRLYGVSNGVRHFHADIRELELEDFLGEALAQAQHGNTVLLSALPAIEAAVADIIGRNLNTTAQVV